MSIQVTAEGSLLVGTPTVVESFSQDGLYSAVFEDDGQTAYFYAIDPSDISSPIKDALHIYNVSNVGDSGRPSTVKIGWSLDSKKVVLLINNYPHGIFDFFQMCGYCRTGFPPPDPNGSWSGHQWEDSAENLFK